MFPANTHCAHRHRYQNMFLSTQSTLSASRLRKHTRLCLRIADAALLAAKANWIMEPHHDCPYLVAPVESPAAPSSELRQQPSPQHPHPISLPGGNCTSEYMQHIF